MSTAPAFPDELLTLEDYLRLPEEEPWPELVRGRLVREPAPGYPHGRIQIRIATTLDAHIRSVELALDCVGPTGFLLQRDPDTVRIPDLAVISRPPDALPSGLLRGAPLVAVEVVSPSNRAAEMRQKVRDFLAGGAEIVWVVHPRTAEVAVHRSGAPPVRLARGNALDGGEVLPGFRLEVAELFDA